MNGNEKRCTACGLKHSIVDYIELSWDHGSTCTSDSGDEEETARAISMCAGAYGQSKVGILISGYPDVADVA